MKTIFIGFMCMLACFSVKSQDKPEGMHIQSAMFGGQLCDSIVWRFVELPDSFWMPSNKEAFTYDGSGRRLLFSGYLWDTTQWIPSWKTTYFYNEGPNSYKNITSEYDAGSGLWDTTEMEETSYNEHGFFNHSIYFVLNPETHEWEKSIEENIILDEAGKSLSWTYSKWNVELSIWDTTEKNERFFDLLGNDSIILVSSRLSNDSVWNHLRKSLHFFDGNGQDTLIFFYTYNDGQWAFNTKYNSHYDENGDLISKQYQYYNDEWHTIYWYDFSYDQYGNQLMQMTYNWINEDYLQPLMQIQSYYSSPQTKTTETQCPVIRLYPNPASEYIIINDNTDDARIQLFSLDGKLVMSKTVHSSYVSVHELQQGIYIYRLLINGQSHTGKIQILR
jgi:hypothetical protein